MIHTFAVSLALTLAIELPIAYLWGLRGKQMWMVVLVNLMTNPLAVALHMAAGIPQIPLEMAVVAAEALIYRSFSRTPGWHVPRPLLLALVSNAVSWSLGLLIQL